MHRKKLLKRLIAGKLGNVAFTDMRNLAIGFGFQEARKSGSNHIYIHHDIPELLNLQEVKGEAKPYQIRQFLRLIERYNLKLENEI